MLQIKKKSSAVLWGGAGALLLLFIVLIILVRLVDVDAVGPEGSKIGLSGLNSTLRDLIGTNEAWYIISEVSGLAAIALAGTFGLIGLCQVIKRKSLQKVDVDILLLGVFYVIVILCYILFEIVIINYRPIMPEGVLEASFPSSHTMLAVSVLGTAVYQFSTRFKKKWLRTTAIVLSTAVLILIISSRLLSGMHWFTDILGGLLLSTSLILAYIGACRKWKKV